MTIKRAVPQRNNADYNVDALQNAGQTAIGMMNRCAIARGALLDTDTASNSVAHAGIAFTGGAAKQLVHGLGVTPSGFMVADVVTGYASFKRTAWDATTITLQFQNTCTVKLWVFA